MYWEEIKDRQNRTVRKEIIHQIKESLEKDFAPISEPMSLSISEVFECALDFIKGKDSYEVKKVYGFLNKPTGITEQTTVSAEAVKRAAAKRNAKALFINNLEFYHFICGKHMV